MKACGRPAARQREDGTTFTGTCNYVRMKGKQRCAWHWLLSQPADVQASYATKRREAHAGPQVPRVHASQWPPGERWCAGCQSFVPLFYVTGSRCRSCASSAAHASRVQSVYGISGEEYDELLRMQGGRCFICQRRPVGKRLAVDHDHATGEVRGLLCANNEHGCNRAVIANLEAAHDGGLPAARRTLLYLVRPPYVRLRGGGALTWAQFIAEEAARLATAAEEPPERVSVSAPPF